MVVIRCTHDSDVSYFLNNNRCLTTDYDHRVNVHGVDPEIYKRVFHPSNVSKKESFVTSLLSFVHSLQQVNNILLQNEEFIKTLQNSP